MNEKKAHVSAIYKKGDKRYLGNYRPASEEEDLNRDNECIYMRVCTVSVQFDKTQKLYLDSFYRPPCAPTEQLEELESFVTELFSRPTRRHPNIITGRD